MASAGSVFVDLLLRDQQFVAGMQRASRRSKDGFGAMGRDAGVASRAINGLNAPIRALTTSLGAMAGVAAGAFSINNLIQFSDSVVSLETRLGNVTRSSAEFNARFSELFRVAQDSGVALDSVAQSFIGINTALPDAIRGTTDLAKVTEVLARGFAASGTEAQAARGAMIQIGQGLAADFKSSAQEINSLIEAAPLLARAIAEQLGGNSATYLKVLAADGKLTAESFLAATIAAEDAVKAFEIPQTIHLEWQRLTNEITRLGVESESLDDISSSLAGALAALRQNIDGVISVAGALATVIGIRLVSSLTAKTAATIKDTIAERAAQVAAVQSAQANVALAQSAVTVARIQLANGVGSAAALTKATATLTAAQRGLAVATAANISVFRRFGTGLLALAGGPLGAVAIGLYAAYEAIKAINGESEINVRLTNSVNDAQGRLNKSVNDYVSASKEKRAEIRADVQEQAAALRKQMAIWDAQATAFNEMNRLQRGASRVAGWLGFGPDVDQMEEDNRRLFKVLQDAEQAIKDFDVADQVQAQEAVTKANKDAIKARQRAIDSIRNMVQSLQQEVDTYGMAADEVIRYRIEQGDLAESFRLAGSAADEYRERLIALTQAQMGLMQASEELDSSISSMPEIFGRSGEELEKLDEILRSNRQEIYGLSDAYAALLTRMDEINEMRVQFPEMEETWTTLEQRAVEAFNKTREGAQKQVDQFGDFAVDISTLAETAAENIRDSLADFLFDPFQDGLDGMLRGFSDMLRRMAAEVVANNIMGALFKGVGGEGGSGFGGFLSNLGGLIGLPSFDVGSYRVPRDMVAQIHQDEMIIPAAESRQIRSGGGLGGGTVVNQYISTPDSNSFRMSSRQTANIFKRAMQNA